MPETILAATSAFSRSAPLSAPALGISYRDDLTIASFAAFRDKAAALSDLVTRAFGVALPTAGKRISSGTIAFQWAGPHQWLAIAERGAARDLETELKPLVAGLAAVVDQSDARAVVVISGPRAVDVLAKGLPIDLHERAFATGDAAITHASHIGVTIARLDDAPTFEITMYRSYAGSFDQWLRHAAAEFTHEAAR